MHKNSIKLITSAILLELGLSPLKAATITVDNNTCVLADAITSANTDTATNGCDAGVGADEIVLPQNSTISLTNALPSVTSEITLQGNGSIIERDASAVDNFRILTVVNAPQPVRAEGRGVVGPAVSSLTANDVTLSNGVLDGNAGGGANCYGPANTLTLNNSTVSNNTGGGISVIYCSLNINNSVIQNNTGLDEEYYGAGVNVTSGSFFIMDTTITGNINQATSAGGGGIYLTDYSGPMGGYIQNTTISGNVAEQSGGGIAFVDYGNGATFSVTNSSITNNTSITGAGGGISMGGQTAIVESSTITGNSAATDGGGIAVNDNAYVDMARNIVTGNSAASSGNELNVTAAGSIELDEFNIFGQNNMPGLSGVTGGLTDIVPTVPVNAIISPLADNGGPTHTHALPAGSPAIDAVDSGSICIPTDQRGEARPADGDNNGEALCDIGSFEASNPDVIFINGFD
ncbi:choice-of-anchor Q domain-containing protein [Marinicella sp. W31]|uniref:choice-of-anchor Q domain-containing protein n=1 Tax=Marinicella sp. W31 TaxID=3023713 RepID=UPI003756D87E